MVSNQKHRISAGVIVEDQGRILMVRHRKADEYDFWVAPGGGALDGEDLLTTAKREVFEECGLYVEPLRIAYIEELTTPHSRECKVWFTGQLKGGHLNCSAVEAVREHIVEAAWLSPNAFDGKLVFPPMLHHEYWIDKEHGFNVPRYLGLREMEFF